MKKLIWLIICIAFLVGCSAPTNLDAIKKEQYDAGYAEGYAAGIKRIEEINKAKTYASPSPTIKPTATPDSVKTIGHVEARSLNMREKPNRESDIVQEYEGKTELEILEDTGEWYKVSIADKTGYMLKEYVVIDKTPSPTKTPTPSTPKPVKTTKPAAYQTSKPTTTSRPSATAANYARHSDIDAWVIAQHIAESYLKAPSTAKFCKYPEATIKDLGNGEYMVTGWVDAENSFGAKLRQTFVVTYTATSQGYKNGSAIFY